MVVTGVPVAQRPKKGYKMNEKLTIQFTLHEREDGSASCAVHSIDSDVQGEALTDQILAAFMALSNVAKLAMENDIKKRFPDKLEQSGFVKFLRSAIKSGNVRNTAPTFADLWFPE